MTTEDKKKILIVEDDEKLLRILDNEFSDHGFDVFKAENGREGLDVAFAEHPDVILLDIVMPVMHGMDMLKELREDEWGKNAEVIILTNLSDSERIAKAVEYGTSDYLTKTKWSVED
ncbi:two-component system response regulator, partial [Patescibacteria group bacterium]